MNYLYFLIVLAVIKLIYLFYMPIVKDNDFDQIRKKRRWIYGWVISTIIIILFSTLTFHFILGNNAFLVIPKKGISFSNTFITTSSIDDLVKRYNNASYFEKLLMQNDPLITTMIENGYVQVK